MTFAVSFITAWMLLGILWARTTYRFFPVLSHTSVQEALRNGPWWSKLGLLLWLPWFVVGTEAARLRERHRANERPIRGNQHQSGVIQVGCALPPNPPPPRVKAVTVVIEASPEPLGVRDVLGRLVLAGRRQDTERQVRDALYRAGSSGLIKKTGKARWN